MRFVKSPLRVSIGGGGTDLPFYYKKKGADLTFAAINKYIYIIVNETLENRYQISLESTNENVGKMTQISNKYVAAVLENLNIDKNGLSIGSSSEVHSGTGLGSSGAFTVALLKALEKHSQMNLEKKELAEEAFEIERTKLNKSCGKQDQYAAAFGGIQRLKIKENGDTKIERVNIDKNSIKDLETNLMLFYTNEKRYSEGIIKEQKRQMTKEKSKMNKMDEIKEIGQRIVEQLEKGNISKYGNLLDQHWNTKKKFTEKMTNPKIDKMYSKAKQNGALGGKIVGAGGGGFLLLYAEKKNHNNIKQALQEHNAKPMNFKFEKKGCKTIHER